MTDLSGLIIRNDHDELLLLLERYKLTDQIIVNYDRHSDLYKNPQVDVGSWGHYGKEWGIIKKFIWVPRQENIVDFFRIKRAKRHLLKMREPVVLSICYDYFAGNGIETNLNDIHIQIMEIARDIRMFGLSINFVFAARSPEWTQVKYLKEIDRLLVDEFKQFGFEYSPLSQKILTGRF